MNAYCLFCRTHKAEDAALVLEKRGIERAFSPRILRRKRVKGTNIDVEYDLLPGYVFAYSERDLEEFDVFRGIPGAIRWLRENPDRESAGIYTMKSSRGAEGNQYGQADPGPWEGACVRPASTSNSPEDVQPDQPVHPEQPDQPVHPGQPDQPVHPEQPDRPDPGDRKSPSSLYSLTGSDREFAMDLYLRDGIVGKVVLLKEGDKVILDDPLFKHSSGRITRIDYKKQRARVEYQFAGTTCHTWIACDLVYTGKDQENSTYRVSMQK